MQDNQQNEDIYDSNQADPYAATAQFPDEPEDDGGMSISWTASEFVHHEKKAGWYLGLAAITLALAAGAYLVLNRDVFTLVIIVLLGIIFGVAGARKPKIQDYVADEYGLIIGQKHYNYEDFKSFSYLKEGSIYSLVFMPAKRFSTLLSIYVPEENFDSVADLVGMYLPLEQHETTFIDKFLSKIKF